MNFYKSCCFSISFLGLSGGFSQSLNLYSGSQQQQQQQQSTIPLFTNIPNIESTITPLAISTNTNFNFTNSAQTVHTPQTPTTSIAATSLASSSPSTYKNLSIILPGDKKPKMISGKKQDIKADVVSRLCVVQKIRYRCISLTPFSWISTNLRYFGTILIRPNL